MDRRRIKGPRRLDENADRADVNASGDGTRR
jgi:hypothetical protein